MTASKKLKVGICFENLLYLIRFDKNSLWDDLNIPPKGVVCQEKKSQVY
jgi:hypothetical protein